ncbi:MAG: NADPH-dependent F420 reductase [Burkholderiales bacterium]|nr:NADPH-dependent F420 reductase [Burkholderiales bacterium]
MNGNSTIAVLGGTGNEGGGLALRWAKAGHRVIIGSRDEARARAAAAGITARLGSGDVTGASNRAAAAAAGVIVLTVPHAAQRATVQDVRDELPGKIVVDATVPLVAPGVSRVQMPADGSAVASIQRLLGSTVRVVSAFQNVSAHQLADVSHAVNCDVLVCGNDADAREVVVGLARDIGLRAFHAGPIDNSVATEALTSVLIALNIRYKVKVAGIRISGIVPGDGDDRDR